MGYHEGRAIRGARVAAGVSLRELAIAAGVDIVALGRYERGVERMDKRERVAFTLLRLIGARDERTRRTIHEAMRDTAAVRLAEAVVENEEDGEELDTLPEPGCWFCGGEGCRICLDLLPAYREVRLLIDTAPPEEG